MKEIRRWAITAIVGVVIFITASAGSFYLGYEKGFSQTKNIVIGGVKNMESPDNLKADFSVFWQAWDKLKTEHINGSKISPQDFVYGAIKGLAGSLRDDYTTFFTPDEAKKFNQDVKGSFGGIGAEIGKDKDQLIVVSPLKNTPAEKAGLRPKDKILKINSESTNNLSVDEAVAKIRGEIGTKVTLNVFRDGFLKPKDFELLREEIQVPTLDWTMKDGDILYVQLYSFNNNVDQVFYDAMVAASAKNPKGIVLDLRSNPGGYFDVAIDLAGWFLKRGDVVVKQENADGSKQTFLARGNEALTDIPTVILVNEGSASASEILAGALHVDRGIKLVGEKSFGKGTVQELDELKDGSLLKVTIAHWLLPNGVLIDKNGLNPDYTVDISEDDIKNKRDPQLDKAIEIVNQLKP